jgi:hypothetical protein
LDGSKNAGAPLEFFCGFQYVLLRKSSAFEELLRLPPLPFAEAARILGADGAFMKLSVSSACLFLGIIFLVSLWISHKNFKNF